MNKERDSNKDNKTTQEVESNNSRYLKGGFTKLSIPDKTKIRDKFIIDLLKVEELDLENIRKNTDFVEVYLRESLRKKYNKEIQIDLDTLETIRFLDCSIRENIEGFLYSKYKEFLK